MTKTRLQLLNMTPSASDSPTTKILPKAPAKRTNSASSNSAQDVPKKRADEDSGLTLTALKQWFEERLQRLEAAQTVARAELEKKVKTLEQEKEEDATRWTEQKAKMDLITAKLAELETKLNTAEENGSKALKAATAAKQEAAKASEALAELSSQLADLKVQLQSNAKLLSSQAKQLREMETTENNRSEAYMAAGQFEKYHQQTQQQLESLKGDQRRTDTQVQKLQQDKERAEAAAVRRAKEAEVDRESSKIFMSLPVARGNKVEASNVLKELIAAAAKKGYKVALPAASNFTLLKPKNPGGKADRVSCIVQMANAQEALSCLRVKRCLNEAGMRATAAQKEAVSEQGEADGACSTAAGKQQQPQQQKDRGMVFIDECLTKEEKLQRESQEELRQELRRKGISVGWRRGTLVKAVQNARSGAWHWVEAAAASTAIPTKKVEKVEKIWVAKEQ